MDGGIMPYGRPPTLILPHKGGGELYENSSNGGCTLGQWSGALCAGAGGQGLKKGGIRVFVSAIPGQEALGEERISWGAQDGAHGYAQRFESSAPFSQGPQN